MSDGSTIEWLDRPGTKPATWNPIRAMDKATGKRGWFCVHVHEGCRFCYAEIQNTKDGHSGGNGHAYAAQNLDKVDIILHEPTLLQPLNWRSPRTVFVCSMTDLYGPWVKDEWLDKIKAVQALTPQHTYIELTKRPERMRDYNVARAHASASSDAIAIEIVDILERSRIPRLSCPVTEENQNWPLPLKNVWGLVSCSTQEDADKFIPILLSTPLAIRGVSAEPLLGPIHFGYLGWPDGTPARRHGYNALLGARYENGQIVERIPKLDWIIVGGESGRNARPMHPDWSDSINAQCDAAGVPLFFKQWGEWAPHMGSAPDGPSASSLMSCTNYHNFYDGAGKIERQVFRVGKTRAGRLLDGAEHNGFPQARTT